MPRYWVTTRHPDQHAVKSGHLETLSRVSSAEIAMRCGVQRGLSARGTANVADGFDCVLAPLSALRYCRVHVGPALVVHRASLSSSRYIASKTA